MSPTDLRLAEVLAALSVTTDLGMGHPPEEAMRSCLVATGLARAMDLPQGDVADVYYTALLQHLGCTATAHEEALYFGGDELRSRPGAERADFASPREVMGLLLGTGKGLGPMGRPRALARAITTSRGAQRGIFRAVCEVAARMAGRLGMTETVRRSLYQSLERWDGKGAPQRISGEDIALPARLCQVATQAVVFERVGGAEAAVEVIRRRAGTMLDPAAAELFARTGPSLLAEIAASDAWEAALEAEPPPTLSIAERDLDWVARAFADMVDLKSPFTLGHSTGVAELAEAAARQLGMRGRATVNIRRAALLHDLGRVAVSAGVWDKGGPLTRAEQEQVRLHPYHTERILSRSEALAPLAKIAGMHHERVDGSGYHQGAAGAQIPRGARIVAAADAYQAMSQRRPHRPPVPPGDAARELVSEAEAGRLDLDSLRAVLTAAGQRPPRTRLTWPAGLSDREVEVLRLLAAGASNRDIASVLFISPRTAEHHVQHIYAKIGMSTRAGAALFAMEHGLIPR